MKNMRKWMKSIIPMLDLGNGANWHGDAGTSG